MMRVELDIFSGRPNPRFALSPTEEKAVTDLYESLSVAAEAAIPAKEGLGYRGFRILDSQSALVATVRGTVVQMEKGTAAAATGVKFDEDRRLELTLLQISRSHLSPETYAFLKSQLET